MRAVMSIAFFIASTCLADVDDVLGGVPASGGNPAGSPTSHKLNLTVGGIFGAGGASYNLTSQGFNVYLPLSFGTLAGAFAGYKIVDSAFKFEMIYTNQRTSFSNISSVSPSNLSVSVDDYSFGAGFDLSSVWSVYAGYRFKNRSATRTTPQDVVSSVVSSGPWGAAEYGRGVNETDKIKVRLSAFFPNYYDETSTSSGYSNFSYNLRLQTQYRREVRPDLFASLGLWVEYDSSSFSGTGTRLTTDAREGFLKVYIPLTLEVEF